MFGCVYLRVLVNVYKWNPLEIRLQFPVLHLLTEVQEARTAFPNLAPHAVPFPTMTTVSLGVPLCTAGAGVSNMNPDRLMNHEMIDQCLHVAINAEPLIHCA